MNLNPIIFLHPFILYFSKLNYSTIYMNTEYMTNNFRVIRKYLTFLFNLHIKNKINFSLDEFLKNIYSYF